MRYTKQLKNQRLESLPAALVFVKLIYKLNARSHTASNAYKPTELLLNLVVFKGVPGFAVDSAAMILSMYRLFNFFIKFGELSCKFYTVSDRALYLDSSALNYMCVSKLQSNGILDDQFLKSANYNIRALKKTLISENVDAVFMLDTSLRIKVVKQIAGGPYFLFGLCSSSEKAFLFDIQLPVGAASLDLQYLFIEMALYGICLGQSKTDRNTSKMYSSLFLKIKGL